MTFTVEPAELTPLASTLDQCSDDAEAIRRYLRKWSDFRTMSDLLKVVSDPHDQVRSAAATMLGRLEALLKESSAAVTKTVASYRATDYSEAARFDATLPSSTRPDPADNDIYRPRRPKASDLNSCVGNPVDPTDHLKAPPKPHGFVGALDTVENLISPSFWIDAILRDLIGKEPFGETTRFFVGDWEGYARCAEAFERVNKALNAIAVNVAFRNERVGHTWTGNAADTANAYFHRLADAIANQRWVFQKLHREYLKAADAAWFAADQVSTVVNGLADELAFVGIAALTGTLVSGGTGALIGAGLAAERVLDMIKRWEKATKEMNKVLTTWKRFAGVVVLLSTEIESFKNSLPDNAYTAQVQ